MIPLPEAPLHSQGCRAREHGQVIPQGLVLLAQALPRAFAKEN